MRVSETPETTPRRGARPWLRERFASPEAVYGLILYSALIAAVSDDETDSADVLITAVVTLLIFYLAHVFATTLASHGERGFGKAVAHAIHHSSGMLYASIPPTIPLLAGAIGRIDADDAVGLSLIVASLVLGVLGYSAYAQRGAPVWLRLLGAVGTMVFGFVVFTLNALVH